MYRTNREKHNLRKPALRKRPKRNPTHNTKAPLYDRHPLRTSIIHQPRDVLSRHLGELFLEERFEACEDDEGRRRAVVGHDLEPDRAALFLEEGRFWFDHYGL